jgi:hypothetical protein
VAVACAKWKLRLTYLQPAQLWQWMQTALRLEAKKGGQNSILSDIQQRHQFWLVGRL